MAAKKKPEPTTEEKLAALATRAREAQSFAELGGLIAELCDMLAGPAETQEKTAA